MKATFDHDVELLRLRELVDFLMNEIRRIRLTEGHIIERVSVLEDALIHFPMK